MVTVMVTVRHGNATVMVAVRIRFMPTLRTVARDGPVPKLILSWQVDARFGVLGGQQLSLNCPAETVSLNQTIRCQLNVTLNGPEARVLVDFGDGKQKVLSFRNEQVELVSFGALVPRSLANPVTTNAGLDFLLTNTEVTQDSFVTSIEFYAVGQGKIDFMVTS